MFSIRQKILLVFGGLLLVLAGIAIMTILQIQRIGSAIDIIRAKTIRVSLPAKR